jgi:hypothetical protein
MTEKLKHTVTGSIDEAPSTPLTPEQIVQETFDINAKMLGKQLDLATRPSTMYVKRFDGKKCPSYPVNLYVDVSTGRITEIKTVEDEYREAQKNNDYFLDDGGGILTPAVLLEQVSPTLPEGTVRVPITYARTFILPHARQSKDKIYVDRPDSWVRNDQIILDTQREGVELDALITDPIERGILLKSIDDHNITAEPAVVKNA